jgi:bacillopeptidase F
VRPFTELSGRFFKKRNVTPGLPFNPTNSRRFGMRGRLNLYTLLKFALAGVFFLPVLFWLLSSDLSAGEIEENFAEYLNTLSPTEFVSAIVIMTDQADISTINAAMNEQRATREVRHERVISALKIAASRSQGEISEYLEARITQGSVKGYTPYWIMNLMVVQATVTELRQIAARNDVEIVESNFKAGLIEPIGEKDVPVIVPDKGIGVTPGLRAIKADSVWYELGITGLGRLLANLDTGVDGTHPALSGRWRGNHEPWRECWRDVLGYGDTTPHDYHGHGTHVMGTLCGLGAGTNDTIGVAWEAEWIAHNAINQSVNPEFDNDVLDAFQWFADPDGNPGTVDDVPDVVQNSWGIDARFGYDYKDCDYRWQTVIDNCEAAGVVCIFSAGNEGPGAATHRSPANICNTPITNFAVGAVDATNYGYPYPIWNYSSRGPSDCITASTKPEVVAPGVQVYSSVPGGYEWYWWSGTSMAGPHVSGVVALMRQANPDLGVDSIKHILMNTAIDLGIPGDDNAYGRGIIDAYAAVRAAQQPSYVPGDANGDGQAEMADVVFLINYLFKNGPAPDPMAAGDANHDCVVECADVLYLVNYLFKGGTAPQYGCA